ncbi:MAG: PEGA domain-containing protein [Treponemataceae bacterium]|nr:PEGA domain-containing protein [Treponemataceae bacterium]
MLNKLKKPLIVLPEDEVHLKPILGIPPKQYIPAVYGLGLSMVLFFLLVYPGFHRPGAYLRLSSDPWGIAVRIDGVYQGTTPCTIWVKDGTHTLTLVSPGFSSQEDSITIKGRKFATLLFPDYRDKHYTLTKGNQNDIMLEAAQRFTEWTFTGEPTATYQIPMVLSEAAYRYGIWVEHRPCSVRGGLRLPLFQPSQQSARFLRFWTGTPKQPYGLRRYCRKKRPH